MRTNRITAPANYPLALDDAKDHLRIEDTTDDALITDYIAAATDWLENYTRRKIATQTWEIRLNRFPSGDEVIILPFGNVQAVKSVIYADSASSTITLSGATSDTPGTGYQESLASDSLPFVIPAYGSSWPSVTSVVDPVVIQFVCGYGDIGDSPYPPIPEQLVSSLRIMVADLYERRSTDDVRVVGLAAKSAAERLAEPYVLPAW